MSTQPKYSLLNNSRFYILVSSFFVSIVVLSLVRLQVPSDQLFYIRVQQIFGLLCIFFWYAALAISPLGYVIGKQRMRSIEFSRRAIGVSAAYFAVLHAAIALWGQLGGITGLTSLSPLFQWSITFGFIGVAVLLAMAATSFDSVIRFMTFRKWKWLHRLTYAAGILVVLHIWSIGTHVGYGFIQLIAFFALVILAGLEMFKVVTLLSRKHPTLVKKQNFYGLFITLWAVWIGLIISIPFVVSNYRDSGEQHETHSESNNHDGHEN